MPFLPAYSFFANSNLFLYIKKDTQKMGVSFGAEGEIRTLASVSRPTPLAGAPRHQLEYFSRLVSGLRLFYF